MSSKPSPPPPSPPPLPASPSTARPSGAHYEGDLRAALVAAATAAIDELGADGLSLREVARRAGVSHAAPAHHFGDKRGLLTAVAAHGFDLFVEALAPVLGDDEADPVDRLPTLAAAYATFAAHHPGVFDVMFRPGAVDIADPDYDERSRLAFAALVAHVRRCQEGGWRAGRAAGDLAAGAWSLAHGLAVLRNQGSLQLHHGLDAPGDVAAVVEALLG